MTANIFLLAPSGGLGGGIERYVAALEWALGAECIQYWRGDLANPGPRAHAELLGRARCQLRSGNIPTRIVVAHRALLPVAHVIARQVRGCGISVICHGVEVWGTRRGPRQLTESYLMRRNGVRAVAVSSFTAGALGGTVAPSILPPGLARPWFDLLVAASAAHSRPRAGIRLVTAFRLADWQDKGLPELLQAVCHLRRPEVSVTVCGSGQPPPGLCHLVEAHQFCVLRCDLHDAELAREMAQADLFVLATRTRLGRNGYGEGFGLVLLEAQVAGTPVIAPACGGSSEAYLEGVTGAAPADESAQSLADVLREVLAEPGRLASMADSAASWSREAFAPGRYASRVVARLL